MTVILHRFHCVNVMNHADLFTTVYVQPLEQWYGLVLPASVAVVIALFLSYGSLYQDTLFGLVNSEKNKMVTAKRAGITAAVLDKARDANYKTEAAAWALFLTNALFMAFYGFLFNYALSALDVEYKFGVSMFVAGAGTWYLGSLKYNQ